MDGEPDTCHVSRRILTDGAPVGYMVRDELGWSFLAGDETQQYVDDPANLEVVAIARVVERDPAIAEHLRVPVGTALVRTENGFAVETRPAAAPNPDQPVAAGELALSPLWSLTLPEPMHRRREGASLVLWRPGLTLWCSLWDLPAGATPAEYVDRLPAETAAQRFDVRRWRYRNVQYVGYRMSEPGAPAGPPPLYGIAAADAGCLHVVAYFDAEATAREAGTLLASARIGTLC